MRRNIVFLALLIVLLTACSNNEKLTLSNKDNIDISDIIKHFERSGFIVSNERRVLAEIIGAEYGYDIDINNSKYDVELYKFDIENADQLTKENIEHAKITGNLDVNGGSLNLIFKGDIAIHVSEKHPDKTQIEEAFVTFPNEYEYKGNPEVAEDNLSKDTIINKITTINGNEVDLGGKYDNVRNLLGEPEEEFGDGGEALLKYGDISIGFTTIDIGTGEFETILTDIHREDIFTSKEEVISILGEPQYVNYIEELDIDSLNYLIEEFELSVWVDDRQEVSKVMLTQVYTDERSDNDTDTNSSLNEVINKQTLPEEVNTSQSNLTVETEEITTDLSDGNFARIQFQLVADSEKSKEELTTRDFQVNNIILKELAQLSGEQLENNELYLTNIQESINQLLSEGEVVDIYIINKIIQ